MACKNTKAACGEYIVRVLTLFASGAAIFVALYTLIVISLSGKTDVSFKDILSVIQHPDTADPRKRILILNIITIVIGIIMWILVLLSLILKCKHSMFFAVVSIVFIIIESLGFGATGILTSLSVVQWFDIIESLSQLNQLFTNSSYLIDSGGAAAATAGISLLTSVTSGILALTEVVLLVKRKLRERKQNRGA